MGRQSWQVFTFCRKFIGKPRKWRIIVRPSNACRLSQNNLLEMSIVFTVLYLLVGSMPLSLGQRWVAVVPALVGGQHSTWSHVHGQYSSETRVVFSGVWCHKRCRPLDKQHRRQTWISSEAVAAFIGVATLTWENIVRWNHVHLDAPYEYKHK